MATSTQVMFDCGKVQIPDAVVSSLFEAFTTAMSRDNAVYASIGAHCRVAFTQYAVVMLCVRKTTDEKKTTSETYIDITIYADEYRAVYTAVETLNRAIMSKLREFNLAGDCRLVFKGTQSNFIDWCC